jgi:hypothetical protein
VNDAEEPKGTPDDVRRGIPSRFMFNMEWGGPVTITMTGTTALTLVVLLVGLTWFVSR